MKNGRFGRAVLLAAGLLAIPAALSAQVGPGVSDMFCAGFFSPKTMPSTLHVQGSEDVNFKNELVTGDYVYLNAGSNVITSTGAQYMVLRPVQDVDLAEVFPGQKLMIQHMGQLYSSIARIEVEDLHDRSATAKIVMSCEPVHAGDIAVPLSAEPELRYKSPKFTARFMSSSGKAIGVIALAKNFDQEVGEGRIVYLNIGTAQGLKVGSYLAIVRTYLQTADSEFGRSASGYGVDDSTGVATQKLTLAEMRALPREVLGEAMVLSTDQNTATAIITYSRSEVNVGDFVELE